MSIDSESQEEITRFEERYAQDPHGLAFARLADAYRKAGELERGLALVEDGLSEHRDYLNARIVRARILRDQGQIGAATRAFQAVLDLDGQNLVALRALGNLARFAGDRESARQWYERALEVEPLDEQMRSTLEELGGELGPAAAESERQASSAARDGGNEERVESVEDPEATWLESLDAPPEEAGSGGERRSEERRGNGPEEEEDEQGEVETATLAELYLKQGLYDEAVGIYGRLVGRRPDDFYLLEKLKTARLLAERGPRTMPVARGPAERPVPRDAAEVGQSATPTGVETTRTEPAANGASADAGGSSEETGTPREPQLGIRDYLLGLLGAEEPARLPDETDGSRFESFLRRTDKTE